MGITPSWRLMRWEWQKVSKTVSLGLQERGLKYLFAGSKIKQWTRKLGRNGMVR